MPSEGGVGGGGLVLKGVTFSTAQLHLCLDLIPHPTPLPPQHFP